MSKPWMKFYPADWRSDPALRMCPMAARGLWMEMLCIMHEADPYGHLVVKGIPMNDVALARMAGITLKECRNSLATLRQLGVCSVSDEGVIYSRRMERDAAKALKDKEFGSKGGNPALKGGVNPEDKAQKPEARSQISELELVEPTEPNPERPEPDNLPAASLPARKLGHYVFEAGIIRLIARDFDRWEKAWPNISLRGELEGLAGAAQREHDSGGSWFHMCAGALAKRDREARLAVEGIKANALAMANAPAPRKPVYLGP